MRKSLRGAYSRAALAQRLPEYLGSVLGFAIHAMVNHRDLYERIRREAESLFGDGRMPGAEEFNLDNIDATHRLFLESERMYPVIPWQLRTVMNGCVTRS